MDSVNRDHTDFLLARLYNNSFLTSILRYPANISHILLTCFVKINYSTPVQPKNKKINDPTSEQYIRIFLPFFFLFVLIFFVFHPNKHTCKTKVPVFGGLFVNHHYFGDITHFEII